MDQQSSENPLKERVNAQSQQRQAAEVVEQKAKVKSIMIVLVIVMLFILVGGAVAGVYLWNQSQNDTEEQNRDEGTKDNQLEGWETYTDPEYVYSLEYPSDWILNSDYEKGKDLEEGQISYTTLTVDLDKDEDTVALAIIEISKLDSVSSAYGCDYQYSNDEKEELSSKTIDSVETYEAFSVLRNETNQGEYGGVDFYEEHYCVKTGMDRYLSAKFGVPVNYKSSGLEIFYKILDSIQFLSSQSAGLYEGWNYKKLENCKLSFYYPAEWYFFYDSDEYECGNIVTESDLPATEGTNVPLFISFGKFFSSNYDTPEDYFEYLNNDTPQTIQIDVKNIDGRDCLSIVQIDQYGTTYYGIYFERGDGYYYIMWMGKEVEDYQDEIDKLIDSVDIN